MVVVHPDDVTILVARDNGVCETFVDGDVLRICGGFVEELGLWRIRDGIMQAGPEDLWKVEKRVNNT